MAAEEASTASGSQDVQLTMLVFSTGAKIPGAADKKEEDTGYVSCYFLTTSLLGRPAKRLCLGKIMSVFLFWPLVALNSFLPQPNQSHYPVNPGLQHHLHQSVSICFMPDCLVS